MTDNNTRQNTGGDYEPDVRIEISFSEEITFSESSELLLTDRFTDSLSFAEQISSLVINDLMRDSLWFDENVGSTIFLSEEDSLRFVSRKDIAFQYDGYDFLEFNENQEINTVVVASDTLEFSESTSSIFSLTLEDILRFREAEDSRLNSELQEILSLSDDLTGASVAVEFSGSIAFSDSVVPEVVPIVDVIQSDNIQLTEDELVELYKQLIKRIEIELK